MALRRLVLSLLILLAGAVPAMADTECPQSGVCYIPRGRYLAVPPPGWDGRTPLPTMIFLHGYSQTPENYAEPSGWFITFGAENGVLLILPEGKEKTWSYPGSPMQGRNDTAFIGKVLDHIELRYPVDRKRLWIGGFSQGASMAWYAACAFGDRIAAVTPVAGAFWEPLPKSCAQGPLPMLHIHGEKDQVVPMTGRPIGEHWRQGDVMQSVDVFLNSNGCKAAQTSAPATLGEGLRCARRQAICESRRPGGVTLCMHPGGHWFERAFLDAAWRFVTALPD